METKSLEKTVLKEKKKEEATMLRLTFKAEKGRFILMNVIMGIIIMIYLVKFLIMPLIFKKWPPEAKRLYKVLSHHVESIWDNYVNIILLLLFFGLIAVFFSFDNIYFKHMGLILIIAYITSLAVEADLYITGAVLNAIIAYVYIIILLKSEKKEEDE